MNIKVLNNAVAINSTISVKDIKLLKQYNPSALKTVDENGFDVFSVDFNEKSAGCSDFGITFDVERQDGTASLTIALLDMTGEDVKTRVAKEFYKVIEELAKLEATIPGAADAVEAKFSEAKASVEVL